MKWWNILFLFIGALLIVSLVGARAHDNAPVSISEQRIKATASQTHTPTSTPIRVPILVYHGVRDTEPTEPANVRQFNISPRELERQLQYLEQNGFTSIHYADLDAYFDAGVPLPDKPVILSFDDGWRSQHLNGLPLLKKYGVTATFFLFSNGLDHDNFMSWKEARELVDAGMEIGSHSRSHLYMTKQEHDELLRETAGSKEVLESELGIPITAFSYPYGLYDQNILGMLSSAGYTTARTLHNGTVHNRNTRLELSSYLAPKDMANFTYILNVVDSDF